MHVFSGEGRFASDKCDAFSISYSQTISSAILGHGHLGILLLAHDTVQMKTKLLCGVRKKPSRSFYAIAVFFLTFSLDLAVLWIR